MPGVKSQAKRSRRFVGEQFDALKVIAEPVYLAVNIPALHGLGNDAIRSYFLGCHLFQLAQRRPRRAVDYADYCAPILIHDDTATGRI